MEHSDPILLISTQEQVLEFEAAAGADFPNWQSIKIQMGRLKLIEVERWDYILASTQFHRMLHFLRCWSFDSICENDPISAAIIMWHDGRGPYSDNPTKSEDDSSWPDWYTRKSIRLSYAKSLARIPECDKPEILGQVTITNFFCWLQEEVKRNPTFLTDENNERRCFLQGDCSKAVVNGLCQFYRKHGFGKSIRELTCNNKAVYYTTEHDWASALTKFSDHYAKAFQYKRDEIDSPYFIRRFQ